MDKEEKVLSMHFHPFDLLPDGIIITDRSGGIVYFNPKAKEFFNFLETGEIFDCEIYLVHKREYLVLRSDTGFLIEVNRTHFHIEGQDYTLLSLRDVTTIERTTECREIGLERLLELDSDFIFEMEVNRTGAVYLKWASQGFSGLTGFRPLEITAFSRKNNLIYQKDIGKFLEILDKLKDGQENSIEVRISTKDNRILWTKFSFMPVYSNSQNRYSTILGVGRIFDQNEKISLSQQDSREIGLIENAFINMIDAVVITDLDGNILFVNQSFKRLVGNKTEDLTGKMIQAILDISDSETSESIDLENVLTNKKLQSEVADKNIFVSAGFRQNYQCSLFISPITDARGVQLGYVFLFHDIMRKMHIRRERQIRERLESISLLAGGLAHDFNNILMGIIGNIDLAKMMTAERDVAERLDKADDSIRRAKQLTKQLHTLAKGRKPWKKSIDVRELLYNTVRFALSGTQIRPNFYIAKDIYNIDADEYLINEALNELIRNARDAMPEGGELSIRAKNTIIDEEDGLPLKSGKYVMIKLKDTGKGIENQEILKVINPYFSTKPGSMGMGLPTTHSIIISHNGHLKIDSEIGKGTQVTIFLPATVSLEDNEINLPKEKEGAKILLIDDEVMVREVSGKMLKNLGYKVEYARDLKTSVDTFEKAIEKGEPFDAVIIDLIIDGRKSGVNIIKKLRDIEPDIKAILSSGYSNDPAIINYFKYGFTAVILKPYTTTELREVLKNTFHSDK